jgi:hypothetical protein
MALLIYGSVILHRHRKGTLYRGNYSGVHAQNTYSAAFEPAPAGSYGASSNPFADPHHSSYASQQTGHTAAYPHSAETAYKPQGAANDYYGGGPPNTYEMHGNVARY